MSEQMTVKQGQITFDAEGVDLETSRYFSRVIHWPGNVESGVTIGRGYDMGNRTQAEVKLDMKSAGISEDMAKSLSEGAGLKGASAKKFVEDNKDDIGKITRQQQLNLFNNIYPSYVERAKSNYDKWTSEEKDRVAWDDLDLVIRDVLVDFVYQGFTAGARPMQKGMKNSTEELIKYINESEVMKRYEAGRNRVSYLENGGSK